MANLWVMNLNKKLRKKISEAPSLLSTLCFANCFHILLWNFLNCYSTVEDQGSEAPRKGWIAASRPNYVFSTAIKGTTFCRKVFLFAVGMNFRKDCMPMRSGVFLWENLCQCHADYVLNTSWNLVQWKLVTQRGQVALMQKVGVFSYCCFILLYRCFILWKTLIPCCIVSCPRNEEI